MSSLDRTRGLESLADTLWAERHVVEFLLFKLVAAKLILAADERRFVTPALGEVERVLQALREAELQRAATVAGLAADWGVDTDELTLAELASNAPEPMRSVFRDHQEAFLALAREVDETAAANRRLATAALDHVQQALDALTGPQQGHTYTADGRPDTPVRAPTRLDRVL